MGTAAKIIGVEDSAISKFNGVTLTGVSKVVGQDISLFPNTYSMNFDGSDDHLRLEPGVNLGGYQAGEEVTVSFWIKRAATGDTENIIGNDSASGGTGVYFNGTTDITYSAGSWSVFSNPATQTALARTDWMHVLITQDSSNVCILYIDGVNTETGTGTPNSNFFFDKIGIGHLAGYPHILRNAFTGNIDEVSGFKSKLGASDIAKISAGPIDLSTGLSVTPEWWGRIGDNGSFKSTQWLLPDNANKDKVSNYSMDFDGSNDYVQGPAGNLASAYTQASWSFWFKASSLPVSNAWIYSRRGANDNHGELWGIDSAGKLIGNLGHSNPLDGDYTGATTISTGTWYNVVVTYDGSGITDDDKVKVYLNGGLETLSWTGTVQATLLQTLGTSRYYAVGYGGASYFNGNISNVAVWYGSTLTSGNATSIYNSGTPGDLTSLSPNFFWWKMGEEATFDGSDWTIPDSSTNSNDGTSANMDIADRVGDAPNSTNNVVSLNMVEADREVDTP